MSQELRWSPQTLPALADAERTQAQGFCSGKLLEIMSNLRFSPWHNVSVTFCVSKRLLTHPLRPTDVFCWTPTLARNSRKSCSHRPVLLLPNVCFVLMASATGHRFNQRRICVVWAVVHHSILADFLHSYSAKCLGLCFLFACAKEFPVTAARASCRFCDL